MDDATKSDEDNTDPLALDTESNDSREYDVHFPLEPEIIIEDSQRIGHNEKVNNEEDLNLEEVQDEIQPEPLFPITPKMRARINRMKQRLLATWQLSNKKPAAKSGKRAKQTKEKPKRAVKKDTECRRKKPDKKMARTTKQRHMEIQKQPAARKAKKRERRCTTVEEKVARQEYQRAYYIKNR